jgi:hypothetical protein
MVNGEPGCRRGARRRAGRLPCDAGSRTPACIPDDDARRASSRKQSLGQTLQSSINEETLETRFVELVAARPWSSRAVCRLKSLIQHGSDRDLYRINAITFGTTHGVAEGESIDLLLHSAAVGIFTMDWLLLCPMCACIVESLRSLRSVGDHYLCPMCRCEYESALDEYIAVAFTVSPAVRTIAYHDVSSLNAEDYCLIAE